MKAAMTTACGFVVVALFGASLPSAAVGSEASISGVQKVIQMLTNMKAKGNEEMNEEQVAYAKFNQWCLDESAKLGKEIKKNKADIESLTEEMNKLETQAAQLKDAVAQLMADVTKHEADMQKATAERKSDRAAFVAEEKDYSESVDALGRAIAVLKEQDYDRTGKGAAALLQLSNSDRIPVKVKSIVSAFLGMISAGRGSADGKQEPSTDYQPPEANAYEFQSTSIVEMLKKLEDEFRAKLGECQKEEMNSQHAYDMITMDLTDAKENAETDIKDKTVEMKRKLAKAAANKKQIASTQSVLEANEKTLNDMVTECFEKSLSFQEKQKLRKEELEAIQKAIEILSSDDVAGASATHLELAQSGKAAALVQATSRRHGHAAEQTPRGRALEFLAEESKRLKSKQLGLLAQKLAADPFAKVKKLIDQMITRLLEEAKADADHEGFCDTEIGKSKVTRTRLQEEIDALDAAVEDGKATILELTKSTEELTKAVADLVSAMKEATDIRESENKKNTATIEDAVAAQKAVAAATAVLKDFYKKAMTATAFVQLKREANPAWGLKMGVTMGSPEWNSLANPNGDSVDTGHKEGMQTFGEVEKGQQQEAEYGVLALLEVIQSDFANLEASTKAAEAQSQKAFDEFMIQAKKDQAKKERKIEMNTADKNSAESQMQQDIADLKATQDELIAAEAFYERLVPQCFDKGMTFNERQEARESEIQSLKEALKILDSDDIA